MEVALTDDAADALDAAGAFLRSKPAEHNLVLALLDERARHPEPGRFWWVTDHESVAGVLFQSPLEFQATITPASPEAVAALVQCAADVAPNLPGVSGAAATAAFFAGCWAETRRVPAAPEEGMRLYELAALRPPTGVLGELRVATAGDVDLLLAWLVGFEADTGAAASPPATLRRRVDAGLVWIWDNGAPMAMASLTPTLAGVSRVGLVYTSPDERGRGYGAACTAAISKVALETGSSRCILYTQLSNPRSNAIYRRLGYEPIQEILHYRFG
jgi:predicted GNAT family acetyltransferase